MERCVRTQAEAAGIVIEDLVLACEVSVGNKLPIFVERQTLYLPYIRR